MFYEMRTMVDDKYSVLMCRRAPHARGAARLCRLQSTLRLGASAAPHRLWDAGNWHCLDPKGLPRKESVTFKLATLGIET